MNKIFIDACQGKDVPYSPVWMMRQAGRYLPEYRAVRKDAGDFLSLCKNPKLASDVTLQPIDILDVDAAIMFSDILVVPLELGMKLDFIPNVGPVFSDPIKSIKDIQDFDPVKCANNLSYVYDMLKITRDRLDDSKALIGFCGAPWTLVTYMIEGTGSKTYANVKKLIYTNPEFIHSLLKVLTESLKLYLEKQILSGADAVMIFDSWASALEKDTYLEFGWKYIQEISTYIKSKYPHIPIIAFPKGVSGYLEEIDGDFDVFGVDWSTPIDLAHKKLGSKYVLQGNLEPTRLYSKDAIKEGVEKIKKVMQNKRHIFNLGHGILPDVPVENAKYFVKLVQDKL
ncbi:MAG: Uroporphyrinogen III decarboxylase (EC [uncultured Campylobacterales bacterium]|uniref:Uroporphyrinogen decarboxylase n=1 Tax=uncultured Campylobacterales bacterium TaxID=352960 RepID=A0A6S6SJQ8_9BACT|nr:MAG: Uroporphyrinogen III decarboxylase (EC [uncultured Campylobacterales bacterium]